MNLSKPYNQPDFLEFLKDFLPDFEKDISPINLHHDFKTIANVVHLGRSESLDLDVYEFQAIGKSQKKVSQAIESFKVIKQQMSFRALIAYRSDDDQNWRLALLQMTPDLTPECKRTHKFSNPRRYSFLLGPTAKIKTPTKFLDTSKKIVEFKDLESRFSVEVVNKDFYREIAKFFSRLTGGDRKFGSKTEHFQAEMRLPTQGNPDKQKYQEFAVRLIGRIIFCWFLKQKKSKNGIPLLPEECLSSEAVNKNQDYYHNVLEKVFFEVLNKQKNERKADVRNGFDTIPYLNGGLFDPHEDDYYCDQPFWTLSIPDKWFRDFFAMLETYNFTIDENTVLDTDLSIDPEMLGRIFENLLAEINPETGESARKSTGSYYTPRPIVEYMVDQSLIQYLIAKTEISKEKIKALVSIDLDDDASHPLAEEEKKIIVVALDRVKIIDPACGSGAFPIGILQKIVFILGQVDPNGQLWFKKKLEGIDSVLAEDIRKKFEQQNFDYIRKTGVIKDSIYGVDIQPIAVEVSKLRCFLTLVVDEEIDDSDPENRGIKPLPNLEFKFVAANTLIGLPSAEQGNLFEDHDEINRLRNVRDLYFTSSGLRKEQLKTEFYKVKNQMSLSQVSKGGAGELTMALASWDPFSNKSSDWFDSGWMFGVNKFNIVIGNPPYVSAKEHSKIDKNRDLYRKEYTTLQGAFDLYLVFLLKGISLLENVGTYSWIIPNKLLISDYAKKSLEFLKCNGLNKVINVSNVQVFDAGVYPIIIVGSLGSTAFEQFNVDSLGKLSEGALVRIEDHFSCKTLGDFKLEVCSGTTGFEATKIKLYIKEEEGDNTIPFVVSGSIDPWRINFQNVRYMGTKYSRAYISKEAVSEKKWSFWNSPKIVIAGMTKRIEAVYFEEPLALGVGVYAIKDFKDYSPYYLLGLLNSKFLSYYLKTRFKDKHLAGGYLAINKSTIEKLPFSNPTIEINNQIISFVKSIQDEMIRDEEEKKKLLDKIDNLVYQLFCLTEEEIKIIEESVK